MKHSFLLAVLLCGLFTFAQNGDTGLQKPATTTAGRGEPATDSIYIPVYKPDSTRLQQSISYNMDGILQLQKENREKQKRAAMIRIAIGAGFLAVLVIGLRRRRKN